MKLKITVPGSSNLRSPLVVVILDADKHFHAEEQVPFRRQLDEVRERAKANKFEREAFFTLGQDQGIAALLVFSTAQIRYLPAGEKLKVIASKALRFAERYGIETVTFVLDGPDGGEAASPIAEGCMIASYRFNKYKTRKEDAPKTPAVELAVRPKAAQAVREQIARIEVICDAMALCRDLVNEPAAVMYPGKLADAAKAVCSQHKLECEVLDEKALQARGYMGVYTVGKGSAHMPRMIVMRYGRRAKAGAHLALVGKAISFDTGGYCIKPAKDMWHMKADMSGGAAVIATMKALARLKPDLRVTGIVPSAQNMVNENAYLPGDIIRAKNGKTVHVNNTDAEGRLILMDALVRAREEGATHVVDIATLTGSVIRALGTSMSGILGNDQGLIDLIADCGRKTGEEYWQLPLHEEYSQSLRSDIADIDNSGNSPNAGAIIAALFLKEFVDPELKWAHLDIAGTNLAEKQWRYFSPGATAVGVRTFVELASRMAVSQAGGKASLKKSRKR